MLKRFVSTLFYIILVTIMSTTSAKSQVQEYIDTDYADQGSIENLSRNVSQSLTHISNDSLENIYISTGNYISSDGQNWELKYSLIKITREGTIDTAYQNSSILNHSEAPYYQKDNYIFLYRNIGEITIVDIYDLELNLIQEYRLAEYAEFENIHYLASGHLIGLTDNFFFKYKPDGTLDTTFGADGLIDLNDLLGDFGWGFNRYEFQSDNSDIYITFYRQGPGSSYKLIRFNKDGQSLSTLDLTNAYSSIEDLPYLAGHKLFSATSLPNGHVLIGATGWDPSLNKNKFYQILVSEDLTLNYTYGENGISFLPLDFEERYIVGAFSNSEILLRTGTYDDSPIRSIAILDKEGRLRYDLSDEGLLYLDIKNGSFGTRILIIENDVYVLHINIDFSDRNVHLTKLNFDNILASENIPSIQADIKISPNPTSSLTNLLYTGPTLKKALLHIYSTTGKLILEKSINILSRHQPIEIKTANIASGHYVVTLIHEGKLISSDKMTVVK